ncbi:MAG: glycosyl hydrolase family 28 protein [Bacteroidales bacterium]|nr:glycosyl hydrolase family 28 protein [Bacteroidales bacterium]
MKKKILLCIGLLAALIPSQARDFDVMKYGATGKGKVLDTKSIQEAIDICADNGGGRVVVPKGTYLCGTFYLRDNVDLYLEHGAVIKGSTDVTNKDIYPRRALVAALNIKGARILGPGTIDGQSNTPEFNNQGLTNSDGKRPYLVLFDGCKDVTVKEVHLVNAAFWTLRFVKCDGVLVDGITINSTHFYNNDGIDIDAKNVRIANCLIDALDDGICLKSNSADFMPENIVVTNCVISSNCNPIKFGTASVAGFRNVAISNCVIKRPPEMFHWDWADSTKFYRGIAPGTKTGLGGISIESVDGGLVEHIVVNNITMEGIITPIFLCVNSRHGIGTMRDIHISNITAVCEGILPCMITGIKDSRITDVTLRDITVQHAGGEKPMAGRLRENEKAYPENRMYGLFNPACGLFVRHADNILVENFRITNRKIDQRPAVVLDDVTDFRGYEMRCTGSVSPLFLQYFDCKDISLDSEKIL